MHVEFITLTSKGQLVIPAAIRKRLRLKQGTRVAVRESNGQIILQPVTDEFIDSVQGMLGDTSKMIANLRREHEEEG